MAFYFYFLWYFVSYFCGIEIVSQPCDFMTSGHLTLVAGGMAESISMKKKNAKIRKKCLCNLLTINRCTYFLADVHIFFYRDAYLFRGDDNIPFKSFL